MRMNFVSNVMRSTPGHRCKKKELQVIVHLNEEEEFLNGVSDVVKIPEEQQH